MTRCGGRTFFEAARTYQSYRASLILAYSDAWGALLGCTLLRGALVTPHAQRERGKVIGRGVHILFSERSEADSQTRKFLDFTLRIIQNKYSLENRKSLEMPPGVRTSHHSNAHEQ